VLPANISCGSSQQGADQLKAIRLDVQGSLVAPLTMARTARTSQMRQTPQGPTRSTGRVAVVATAATAAAAVPLAAVDAVAAGKDAKNKSSVASAVSKNSSTLASTMQEAFGAGNGKKEAGAEQAMQGCLFAFLADRGGCQALDRYPSEGRSKEGLGKGSKRRCNMEAWQCCCRIDESSAL
jgi:hypothetical protein